MFKCSKCGECCRNLDKCEIYKELDRGDGTCIYLKDNLCSIYDKRPIICRIDEAYDVFFKEQLSKKDYYKLNYIACNNIKNLKYKEE